jgi:hypothetical protein
MILPTKMQSSQRSIQAKSWQLDTEGATAAGITGFYRRVLAVEPSGFVTTELSKLEHGPSESLEGTVTLAKWSRDGWDITLATYFPPNSRQRPTRGTFLMLEPPERADALHYIQVRINEGGSKGCKEEQGRFFSTPGNEKAAFRKEFCTFLSTANL